MSQLANLNGTVSDAVTSINGDIGSATAVGGVINIIGGTNVTTTAAGNTLVIDAIFASPLTTKGDLYTYSTQDDRLPVGTDGFLLSANSATPTGLEWITAPSSGVTSVSGTLNRITSSGGATPIIDISASYVGQASITTLGTITTGVWTGTDIALADGGTGASLVASVGGIFYSTAGAAAILAGTATAGQLLRSGASAAPTWSTSTYPATNAVSTLLYASSANVMAALATANNGLLVTGNTGIPSILAGPGTTGNILQSNAAAAPSFSTATYPSVATGTGKILIADGTNWIASTPTYPNTSGTAGKVLVSDGTNNVYSTPTFPNASATSRKIIVSDGTNWVASTETYAVPGTSGNVLTSDGTNWVSSAASGGGLTNVTINLTSAQIKALHGTPIQVVAAPGAGKIIVCIEPTQNKFNYGGSNVFVAGAAQTISLYYGTATAVAPAVCSNAQLVGTTSGYYITNATMGSTIVSAANCANLALNLYNPVVTEISGNAANNNTFSCSVTYYIATLT